MITDWAEKWGVSDEALDDLRERLGASSYPDTMSEGSEAGVQTDQRLQASKLGGRLWRNNVGALQSPDGRWIRYGLANDSKKVNDVCKSSDLIGITPVKITPIHVGKTLGQFVSIECKKPGWKFTGEKREVAQLQWITLINSLGGSAFFVDGVNKRS